MRYFGYMLLLVRAEYSPDNFSVQWTERRGAREELRYFRSQTFLKIGPCLMGGAGDHASSSHLSVMWALRSLPLCPASLSVQYPLVKLDLLAMEDSMLSPKHVSVLRCPKFVQAHAFAWGKPFPGLLKLEDQLTSLLGVLWCGIYMQITPYPHLDELFSSSPMPWNSSTWPQRSAPMDMALSTAQDHEYQCHGLCPIYLFLPHKKSDFWMKKYIWYMALWGDLEHLLWVSQRPKQWHGPGITFCTHTTSTYRNTHSHGVFQGYGWKLT